MFSQFFVLSPRGDTIINKDYRADIPKSAAEIFFRKVKFWKGDAPPAFHVDGINFLFIKRQGLFFVFTSKFNVSPAMTMELLNRIVRVFKDYCGVLTEEAMRKNFILVYELLDEIMDYGYTQDTTSETLKAHVYTDPIPVDATPASSRLPMKGRRTIAPTAPDKSIISADRKARKNEIFVDILERLTVLFNSNGYLVNSSIEGSIQMKSFLSGNPALRLALNEDLAIKTEGSGSRYGGVVLDDCNFHDCVNLEEFDEMRSLTLVPPEGEFTVMNYRMNAEFPPPFRVHPSIEESSPYKIELVLRVRAEVPPKNYGSNVVISFPVPRIASTVTPEVESSSGLPVVTERGGGGGGGGKKDPKTPPPGQGQTAEYKAKDREVHWVIRKFHGSTEHTLRTKITLSEPRAGSIRKELGPISLSFEIPMYNVSNLQVRYLKIAEAHKSYKPQRWVRYITRSNSYVCRL